MPDPLIRMAHRMHFPPAGWSLGERVMSRSRLCLVCTSRLGVYLVAVLLVRYAASPPVSLPVLTVLGAGIALELLSGASRWR
jgi:hypothetical protein